MRRERVGWPGWQLLDSSKLELARAGCSNIASTVFELLQYEGFDNEGVPRTANIGPLSPGTFAMGRIELRLSSDRWIIATTPTTLTEELFRMGAIPSVLLTRGKALGGSVFEMLIGTYSSAEQGWFLPRDALRGVVGTLRVSIQVPGLKWQGLDLPDAVFAVRMPPISPLSGAGFSLTGLRAVSAGSAKLGVFVLGTPFVTPIWFAVSSNGTTWASSTSFGEFSAPDSVLDLGAAWSAAAAQSLTSANCQKSNAGVAAAVAITASNWFVGTPLGLVVRSAEPGSSWELVNSTPHCIARVQTRRQHEVFHRESSRASVYVLATPIAPLFATAYIWIDGALTELVDGSGRSFGERLGLGSNALALSADNSIVDGTGHHVLLVSLTEDAVSDEIQRFDIVALGPGHAWERRFAFPAHLKDYATETWAPVAQRHDSPEEHHGIVVKLVGLAFSGGSPTFPELFVWGDVLLYSRNSGRSFRVLEAGGNTVLQLSSSPTGQIAVLNSAGSVLMGRPGSGLAPVSQSTSFGAAIFFDENGKLRIMQHVENGSGLRVTDVTLADDSSVQGAHRQACPFRRAAIVADRSPKRTRIHWNASGLVLRAALPPRVFLDRGDTFMIEIDLFARSGQELRDVGLAFELISPRSAVQISVERKEETAARVVAYVLRLAERVGNAGGNPAHFGPPGFNLDVSSLRLGASVQADFIGSCDSIALGDDLKTDGNGAGVRFGDVRGLEIYLGCPPAFDLELDVARSRQENCNGEPENVVCVNFDQVFEPVFLIRDGVTGVISTFMGKWTLSVVDGAETPPDNWGDSGVARYFESWEGTSSAHNSSDNSSDKIFSEAEDRPGAYVWGCWRGSECAGVMPRFPNTPTYYFLFHAKTSQIDSYCVHSTTFVVRVSNLPLDLFGLVLIWIGTVALLVALLSFGYRRSKNRKVRVKEE